MPLAKPVSRQTVLQERPWARRTAILAASTATLGLPSRLPLALAFLIPGRTRSAIELPQTRHRGIMDLRRAEEEGFWASSASQSPVWALKGAESRQFANSSPSVLGTIYRARAWTSSDSHSQRKIIVGVSPAFAMTKMDDEVYPDADVYTEDERAAAMVNEIVALSNQRDLILRHQTVPYGTASVGRALGMMAKERRFPRPSIVFMDGDQTPSDGCLLLPGGDAPERVVFDGLSVAGLDGVASRISRSPSDVVDACNAAKLMTDHHEWVRFAADRLAVPGTVLWQGMCAEWCHRCLPENERNGIGDAILEMIGLYGGSQHTQRPQIPIQSPLFNPEG